MHKRDDQPVTGTQSFLTNLVAAELTSSAVSMPARTMEGNAMDLNSIMEFDHVIRVDEHGNVSDVPGMYAPEIYMLTTEDGQIMPEHEDAYTAEAKRLGWSLLTGWTGQYGYAGPVMHASEYVGGSLAAHILETPGLYVVITVETLDDSEDAAGWAIAYRES